jgi:hypothetical protein
MDEGPIVQKKKEQPFNEEGTADVHSLLPTGLLEQEQIVGFRPTIRRK